MARWRFKSKDYYKDFGNIKRPSIKFLATVRNIYLEELNTQPYDNFDIIMIVDMDMRYGWDIRGIADSFAQYKAWDAVCSNGITSEGRMYDMFAFRNKEFPQTPDFPGYWEKVVPKGQRAYPIGSKMIHVYSCFGGMALYKRSAILGCNYQSKNEDCEHIAFHRCIIEKNKGTMMLNPSQVIRYPISIGEQ